MRTTQLVGYAALSVAPFLVVAWLATATDRAARRRLRRLRVAAAVAHAGVIGQRERDSSGAMSSGPATTARPVAPKAFVSAGALAAVSSEVAPGTPAAVRVAGRRRPDRVRLVAVVVGVGAAVVLGGWFGCVAGAILARGTDGVLRQIEPTDKRRRRRRESADLPLAADLIAAALRAGAPTDRSAIAVAEAIGGPLAERINRIGRTLRLGGEPEEAWAHLSPVDGGERVARAAIRSSSSGASLAGTLFRIADDLRADRAVAAEAAARRSGVLIVLPLGLCFLPAFILAGLVPVIVAVLGDVL